jgi:prophage DNA circulation protein
LPTPRRKPSPGADAAAQAARLATDTGRALGELAQTLARGQSRTEAAIAAESEATARLAEALRSSGGGVAAAARSLAEIESSLNGVRDGFAALATQNAEGAKTLRQIVAEQEAIASSLSEVAHELGSIAVGSVQRQDASGRDVAALVDRLGQLADMLARSQGLPFPGLLETPTMAAEAATRSAAIPPASGPSGEPPRVGRPCSSTPSPAGDAAAKAT